MDEDNGALPDIPTFINNALKQLISLKLSLSEADLLQANAKSDARHLAKKVGKLLRKIKSSVETIDSKFSENYQAFKQKHRASTCTEAHISECDEAKGAKRGKKPDNSDTCDESSSLSQNSQEEPGICDKSKPRPDKIPVSKSNTEDAGKNSEAADVNSQASKSPEFNAALADENSEVSAGNSAENKNPASKSGPKSPEFNAADADKNPASESGVNGPDSSAADADKNPASKSGVNDPDCSAADADKNSEISAVNSAENKNSASISGTKSQGFNAAETDKNPASKSGKKDSDSSAPNANKNSEASAVNSAQNNKPASKSGEKGSDFYAANGDKNPEASIVNSEKSPGSKSRKKSPTAADKNSEATAVEKSASVEVKRNPEDSAEDSEVLSDRTAVDNDSENNCENSGNLTESDDCKKSKSTRKELAKKKPKSSKSKNAIGSDSENSSDAEICPKDRDKKLPRVESDKSDSEKNSGKPKEAGKKSGKRKEAEKSISSVLCEEDATNQKRAEETGPNKSQDSSDEEAKSAPEPIVENSSNCSNENSDDSSASEKQSEAGEEPKEEKPKVGLIKCIDITKLLDPKIKEKREKASSLPESNKDKDTIILLSSSDSETEKSKKNRRKSSHTLPQDERISEQDIKIKNVKKIRTYERKSGKSKTGTESDLESKKKNQGDSDSDSDFRRKRTTRNCKADKKAAAKSSFERFRSVRQSKMKIKRLKDVSSSSSDSSSSSSSDESKSLALELRKKKSQTGRNSRTDKNSNLENYNYKEDVKFKSKCFVPLPKIPVEQLKEYYLLAEEERVIKRLTNMNSLKRTRQAKSASVESSSDSDSMKIKKRSKTEHREKNKTDDEQHSDVSNCDADISKVNEPHTAKEVDEPLPIPDNMFASSDEQSDKNNDASDKDSKITSKKQKKDKPEKPEEESDKPEGESPEKKEKETDDKKDDMSDSEEEKNKPDKEKSKWRNDKLLTEKVTLSDSDDEALRFRNKKSRVENAVRSNTKKALKRIARRLGSDLSSSESERNDTNESDEENKKEERDKLAISSSESDDDGKTKKKPRRKRIKRMKDSDESSDNAGSKEKKEKADDDQTTRKKIRHVWNKDSLADSTKRAAKEEEERKKRIADRQQLYNDIYVNNSDENAKVDKVVLDFNEETKEELLSVHPELVAKLKPHQAKGVQFMWTACFESLERAEKTEGSGCILAHCMGLGKTLQVITLIHTLLTNSDKTKVRTVLVVCPLSTVLNWVSEFKKWLDDLDGEQVNVFDLVAYRQNYERLYQMQDWVKHGGVLIIGYDMFRNLSNAKGKRMSKKLVNGFGKCLLEPGPDLVVCDEGHLLKNEKTGISIAMNKLKTNRRIVLTGTPLQNNLKEYFCMVQFVKPSLLGTYKEYLNRFVNPITNGQYTDSTPLDINIMRRRAHVLHKMLDAVVERRDYNVLAPFLPPKHEFVLFISLTEVQTKLYREYLEKFSRNTNVKGTSYLFQDFQELQRICLHPRVLLDKSNQDRLRKDMEDDDSEGSLKDFINDDDTDKATTTPDDSSSDSESGKSDKKAVRTRRTRANPGSESENDADEVPRAEEWWSKFCQGDELDNICHSSKLSLLFDILHQCELIGDKVLVFSQSLFSLNVIEYFLARTDEATQNGNAEASALVGGHAGSWTLGLDYFRMDGSTSCDNRAAWCKSFNNESNTRARLFLISTRAGGLGINLVAANRVIIFDVSWNPSYDIQSIYRVYRFGQTKPSYIYRFVTMGTMENKIYERQVTKQAISKRVIDEQQIDRHYNQNDLAELYAFNPIPDEERPIPLVPKDRLFADLLQVHDKHIYKYHEHNSLLENKADEGLNEEERRAAWEEFENEKKAPKFNLMQTMVRSGMYETLRILVQQDNSTWTPAQVNSLLPSLVQKISEQVAQGDYSMYRRVEEKHEMRVLEQRRMQYVYQQYMQQLRTSNAGSISAGDINKLAQMFNTYNQSSMTATSQGQQQRAGGSGGVSFALGDPPPLMPFGNAVPGAAARPPVPHPAVNEVVELND